MIFFLHSAKIENLMKKIATFQATSKSFAENCSDAQPVQIIFSSHGSIKETPIERTMNRNEKIKNVLGFLRS